MTSDLPPYRSRAVRALVTLHERELRLFHALWREADEADVDLPATTDAHYASRASLLRHVLAAARGYLVWMTEQLGLPDPGVDPAPEVDEVVDRSAEYLDHLLERWGIALRDVPDARLEDRGYPIWGVESTIDAMLEHAVMHPIRHAFQLEELM